MSQTIIAEPKPLTEKYRPKKIAEFVGLDRAKKIVGKLAANSYQSAWLFIGPSGTGKTSMALALASEMPAELHHIPARECTLESVQAVCKACHYAPRQLDSWQGANFHVVVIDEADSMSSAAQLAFLSKLDATDFPPSTIFIFTANDTNSLEKRFLSRCRTIDFSSYDMSGEIVGLLSQIWERETDAFIERPDFARIVKDSCNNVRAALMSLEIELMAA
jgi:DNA polymerase III gamma/tau subunit